MRRNKKTTMVKKRMKTNAKTNTILEKKLEELEFLLEGFGSGDHDLNNAYREIELRFIFTQTLLTAEISSVNDSEEEGEVRLMKLRCMAKKLAELEETFVKQLTGPTNEPEMQSVGVVDETGSIFSLVETLQEEFGDDGSLEENVEDAMARRENDRIKKNRFRGLVSFGIVGFIAGMVSFYGYLSHQMNEDIIFLTPT